MRRDAERADSILEGAPTGVVISALDDPKTFWGFCCGPDDPPQDVDEAYRLAEAGEKTLPCNYHCCPIYRAGQDVDAAERVFEAAERPPTQEEVREIAKELGYEVPKEDAMPTTEELSELFGFETGRAA